MTTLFATLGFTPHLALAPLRHRSDVDVVHLFYGSPLPDEAKKAVPAARATIETLGLKLVEHRIKGAFDYNEIVAAISHAIGQVDGDVIINASGGTRPMIMAATIAAWIHDVPLVYYDDYETQEGTVVPLRAFLGLQGLGDTKRRILEDLQRGGETDMGSLADRLGIAASTLTAHVQELERTGTVATRRDGKRRLADIAPEIAKVDLRSL